MNWPAVGVGQSMAVVSLLRRFLASRPSRPRRERKIRRSTIWIQSGWSGVQSVESALGRFVWEMARAGKEAARMVSMRKVMEEEVPLEGW